jgi:hypothetical protein
MCFPLLILIMLNPEGKYRILSLDLLISVVMSTLGNIAAIYLSPLIPTISTH